MAKDDKDYSPIFKPITINNVEIKNRIVMSAMNCNYTGPDHYMSRQQMAYYAARAKGGTGLIITEATAVSTHPVADTYRKYNNPYLTDGRYVTNHANFVEHVQSFGAKVFAQLFTGPGRQGGRACGAVQPVSASAIPYRIQPTKMIRTTARELEVGGIFRLAGYFGELPTHDPDAFVHLATKVAATHLAGETPREITVDEIQALVRDIGKGARYARIAGYDGIEIHACHGYLVHSFMSKRSNVRQDQYGGPFENRIRFLLELLRSARKAVGPDFPVGVRISASEDLPGGFDAHFTNAVAKRCEEEGADFIDLSDGSYEAMSDFLPNDEGQVIDKAAIIKQGLNIPVLCPSVHNPDNIVDALTQGKADMIMQGRQQLADPEWVNKVSEGRTKEIIRCIRCNRGCIMRFIFGLPVRCILNPTLGQEEFIDEYMRRPIIPVKKRVWKSSDELFDIKVPAEPYEYSDKEMEVFMGG